MRLYCSSFLYYSSFPVLVECFFTTRFLLYLSLLVFTVFTAGAAARARVAESPRELALFTTRALVYCCFMAALLQGGRMRVRVSLRRRANSPFLFLLLERFFTPLRALPLL